MHRQPHSVLFDLANLAKVYSLFLVDQLAALVQQTVIQAAAASESCAVRGRKWKLRHHCTQLPHQRGLELPYIIRNSNVLFIPRTK